MDDEQLHARVAEFLHILGTNPAVLKEWQQTPKNPAAMGPFIQRTLKLDAAPSETDLKKMADHGDSQLAAHMATLHGIIGGSAIQCGGVVGMTQK